MFVLLFLFQGLKKTTQNVQNEHLLHQKNIRVSCQSYQHSVLIYWAEFAALLVFLVVRGATLHIAIPHAVAAQQSSSLTGLTSVHLRMPRLHPLKQSQFFQISKETKFIKVPVSNLFKLRLSP